MPYHVLYASSAADAMGTQQLADLLAHARAKNDRLDVTGFLVYRDGAFVQVIEGEKAVVASLYDTIKADDRHYAVTTLRSGDIDAREFSGWAMGFRDLSGEDLEALREDGDDGASLGVEEIEEHLAALSGARGHAFETLRRFTQS